MVSAKQFDKGLRQGQYLYSLIPRQTEPKRQFNFTHRKYFGTTGSNEAYDSNLVKLTLEQIKKQYPEVFKKLSFPINREKQLLYEHKIPLKNLWQPPSRRKNYPLDSKEFLALKQEIENLLESNRIRPSDSLCGAPILFVKMKAGSLRMCIDYCALNKNTEADSDPLPRIDEILTRPKGAQYLSRLDFRDSYYQLPMA